MKQSRLSNIAYRQQRCDWAVRLGPGVIGPLGPVYLPSPWPPPEGRGITVHCLGIFVLFDPAAFYSDGLRIVPVAQICLSRLRTLRQAQDGRLDWLGIGRRASGAGRNRIAWALFTFPLTPLFVWCRASRSNRDLGTSRAPRGTPGRSRENQENLFAVRWACYRLFCCYRKSVHTSIFGATRLSRLSPRSFEIPGKL